LTAAEASKRIAQHEAVVVATSREIRGPPRQ